MTDALRSNPSGVLIANAGYPFPRALAISLAQENQLVAYIEAWAASTAQTHSFTALIARSPLPGSEKVSRRLLNFPSSATVRSAAIPEELVRFALSGFPTKHSEWSQRLQFYLLNRRDRSISRYARSYAHGSVGIVASYGAAKELFATTMNTQTIKLLDYPIAHNRYKNHLMKEEARHDPEFSVLGNSVFISEPQLQRMDCECDLADFILVASHYSASTFVDHGISSTKIATVPLGLSTVRVFNPRSWHRQPGPLRVLFVGNLSQLKGLRYLLEAARSLGSRQIVVSLVGAPTGPSEPILKYGDIVQLHGYLTGSKLQNQFRSADVLVLPSLVEGFGMAALEAMSYGIPVICTNTGPSEFVREGVDGFLVPIRDSQALRIAFEQLIDQPRLHESMRQNALEQATNYSLDRYLSEVRKLLELGSRSQ